MPVTIVKDATADLMKAVDDLTKSRVLVGFADDGAARTPEAGETDVPSNAVLAYLSEMGAPDRHIPQRAFLVPGVEGAADKIAPRMAKGAEAAISGDAAGATTQLEAVGLILQSAVRAQMTDGTFAPLNERTLEARRARGRTGDKPLIDTGQMRNAVAYVVQVRGS